MDNNFSLIPSNELLEGRLRTLFEPGSVSFSVIHEELNKVNLNDQQLALVKKGVVGKIIEILESGHFGDLSGAQELLDELEVDSIGFGDETFEFMNVWLNKLTFNDINTIGLKQRGIMGEYNINDVRALIQSKLPEGKIASDELIERIVASRHILYKLKELKVDMVAENNFVKLLSSRNAYYLE